MAGRGAAPELIWRTPLTPRTRSGPSVAVSGDQRTIAWWPEWEAGPEVRLVDAATGRLLHVEPGAALRLFPTSDGFLTQDLGWRRGGGSGDARLVAFHRRGDRIEVTRQPMPGGGSLASAAPTGDRVLVYERGVARLLRWPDLESLDAWRWSSPGVDWAAGCVWGLHGGRGKELRLCAIDRSWERVIPCRNSFWQVHRVGDGVLRTGYHGIRLFRPRGPLATVLPPTSRWLPHGNVAASGRLVRAVLGGKPRQFRVDLDTGRVVEAPSDAAVLARPPPAAPRRSGVASGSGHRRGRLDSAVAADRGVGRRRLPIPPAGPHPPARLGQRRRPVDQPP